MASNENGSIKSQANDTILSLFLDACESKWQKFEQKRVIITPSSASGADFNVEECCKVPTKLKEGFDHIFEHNHIDTFWEDLVFKLKRATSIHPVASRKRRNEEHLVTSLIYPTLKKVVDSISIIPGKWCTNGSSSQQSEGFSSYLVIQDEIKIGDASGRPPAVDATIQINDGEDCKVLIPVEAKVEIEQKHLFQIAAYVTKVSTAKDLKENVTVGIIIDKEVFYLVFSPYSVKLDESVPLPIVYISPSIVWKDASPQLFSIIPAALLVIACTCYFQLERIECDKQNVHSQVLDVACELFKNKHEIQPILDAEKITFDDLLQVSKQQQSQIKILKDKLDLLEDKINSQENGVPTDR